MCGLQCSEHDIRNKCPECGGLGLLNPNMPGMWSSAEAGTCDVSESIHDGTLHVLQVTDRQRLQQIFSESKHESVLLSGHAAFCLLKLQVWKTGSNMRHLSLALSCSTFSVAATAH